MTKDITKLDITELLKLIEEEKNKLTLLSQSEKISSDKIRIAMEDHDRISELYESMEAPGPMESLDELKEFLTVRARFSAEKNANREWIEIQIKHKVRDIINQLGGIEKTIKLFRKSLEDKAKQRKKRIKINPAMLKKMEQYFDDNHTSKFIAEKLHLSIPTISLYKRKMGKTKPSRATGDSRHKTR